MSFTDLKKTGFLPKELLEVWLESWGWTWQQMARNEFPPGFNDLFQFQLAALVSDVVWWCQAFMREPEDPDHKDPYGFWAYQKKEIRRRVPKVYQTGAEVGKTRDIIADSTYMCHTVRNGSGFIGAPQQTHLDEIIDGMRDQMRWNPILETMLVRHRKHPHHKFEYSNEFDLDFRPAGHDGEAFRGIHARTFAKLDEAAKMHRKRQWSEFWRSLKPGCLPGIYSVPDGRRDTDFYLLCKRAEATKKEEVDEIGSLKDAAAHVKAVKFHHVKWSKQLMPPPYWTPERKESYVEQFGGEDHPDYQHNVEGNHGDPEFAVFPWHQLKFCMKGIPEYLGMEVLVDSSGGTVIVKGYKCELVSGDDGPVPRKVPIMATEFLLTTFFDTEPDSRESEFTRQIKFFFNAVPGLKEGGGDFGFTTDPTELTVFSIQGDKERMVARLRLKHVTYDQQCQAIDALDDLYGPDIYWGTDFGNAGSAVAHILQSNLLYSDKNFAERLKGYMFESTTENVNEAGEPIIDQRTGKPAKITLKELATDFLTLRMQRQTMELPPDPDVINSLINHTCHYGKHRIYSKHNDHLIDSFRARKLARVLDFTEKEFFACGN